MEKSVDEEEEYKAKLAAKRKEMREKAEREAEEKRLKEEEERFVPFTICVMNIDIYVYIDRRINACVMLDDVRWS